MLQFTKEIDYGLQLISALAKLPKNKLLSLREFSKDTKISFLFLQRIAKKLREAKIIDAIKGAQGGYYLVIDLKKLTLKQVIEALEGEYAIVDCLKSNCHCVKEKCCVAQKVFKLVNGKLSAYLEELKLSDILK